MMDISGRRLYRKPAALEWPCTGNFRRPGQLALAASSRRRSPALAADGISCSKFSTRSLKIAISRFAPDLY
jgi:hypothetical protein